ncbi:MULTISPECIES: hypothetical protein [Paenibacillus]|uniref:Uncharacterized protein n=1 Tax=Paenibacillus odorifer TaxID=189426 RepID=A0ABX3GUP7_9BACL|nr:hypothetical protein [Paenibacillus odorifer]OMD35134.1 hypothetical protein BSO21_09645 [Paenibacillus odorifer]
MTILAMYRWENNAVFVSDFRVSYDGKNQVDVLSKFITFDNRLGIFTAGNLELWKGAVPIIQSVMREVTMDNVAEEGPLQLALTRYTESIPTARDKPRLKYGGIGFMLDEETGTNIVFSLEGEASRGLRITPLEDGCIVMGSGKNIPMIEDRLGAVLNQHKAEQPDNVPEIESKLKGEVTDYITRCGASAYRKLGISPVFATSRLAAGGFNMTGIETHGGSFSTYGPPRRYHYSFQRIDGQMVLQNHLTNRVIVVNEIKDYSDSEVDVLFDPLGLMGGVDPIPCAVGDTVYFMNQWVEDDFLDRTVYKTGIFYFKGQPMCNPNYQQLANIIMEELDNPEAVPYVNTGDIGLIIPAEKCSSFEAGISTQILNHTWMAEHITNYDKFYDPPADSAGN